jgi:hypothetical protein
MNNINLDINTYSIGELEKLFKLQNAYTRVDIAQKKKNLEENILKSNIPETRKEELYIFLDNINNKLTNNLEKVDESKFNNVKQYDGNHFIIKNENNKYSSVLENNKKVNKSIIKRTYTIDSLFRQNYLEDDNESHDYSIELPETITNAITMTISSLEIPITYHNISPRLNNNIFNIEIYHDPSIATDPSIISVEIPAGLYEARYHAADQLNLQGGANSSTATFTTQIKAANIETEVQTAIDKALSDNSITDIGINFIIKKNRGRSYFQLETAPSNISYIIINFNVNNSHVNQNKNNHSCVDNQLYQKLGWQLGFHISKTPKIHIGRAAESNYICYINYPRYLYIAIDDYQSSSRNYFSIASRSIIAPNIIGRINILSLLEEKTAFKSAAAPGDFFYQQKHVREYFGPTDINKLKIQLLDEYGRPFSINNMDWSFIVSFECFYN